MAAAKKTAKVVEPEGTATLTLDGEALELNIDELTFGEVEYIENYFDSSLEEVDLTSGRGVMVLAFLSLKKTDPEVTLDDVREKKISLLKFSESSDDAVPPTEDKGE